MYIYKRLGSRFFWYSFNFKSQRYKGSTKKTNRRDANEWASQRRRQLIDESVGLVVWMAPPTFSAFAKTYLEVAAVNHQNRPQTLVFYKGKLARLLAFVPLSGARLDHIDEGLIDRYKASRMGKVKVSTCNRELATLSVILHLAHERKLINRIPRMSKSPEGEGRTYVLSRANEEALFAACGDPLIDLLPLMVDTGLRIGEALRLTWDDIRFGPIGKSRNGYLHVRHGKSRSAKRNIPLTTRAESVLRHRSESVRSPWLFPGRSPDKPLQVTSADHQFKKTCDSIRDEEGNRLFPREFVLHSLRHTCLTRLGEQNVGAFDIMRSAGHGSIVTSQRYVHPTPESAQRAIASLDAANSMGKVYCLGGDLPHLLPHVLP
jgi:integrase